MPSIVLVGPWERCLTSGITGYIRYVTELRESINDLKVIFSSMDPPGTIPDGIFDDVVSNKISDITGREVCLENQTARFYAYNSYTGTQLCGAGTVIRVRSDLKIKNIAALNMLLDVIDKYPNNLAIDFTREHNNILPFNYSDFLVAGKQERLLSLFDISLRGPKISRLSILPLTSHIAGLTRGVMTNEQYLWYGYFCDEKNQSRKVDSLINIILSFMFSRNQIFLINREVLFEFHKKYNNKKFISKIDFSKPSRVSIKLLFISISKGFLSYYIKSIQHLISKVIG
ncbi:hypothetical protein G6732_00065 [Polynucleobacter paneuropaeus]|nr:hypothetical protein [Polynucleobacter paneuropaeus]